MAEAVAEVISPDEVALDGAAAGDAAGSAAGGAEDGGGKVKETADGVVDGEELTGEAATAAAKEEAGYDEMSPLHALLWRMWNGDPSVEEELAAMDDPHAKLVLVNFKGMTLALTGDADLARGTLPLIGEVEAALDKMRSGFLARKLRAVFSKRDREKELRQAYADALLAMLAFQKISFLFSAQKRLKGLLAVRAAYNGAMALPDIDETPFLDKPELLQMARDAESYRQFGQGFFLLMLSLVPPTYLRLLSFVGFSADAQRGEELLEACLHGRGPGSNSAAFILIFYRLIRGSQPFNPDRDVQKESALALLRDCQRRYPDSLMYAWMSAHVCKRTGRLEEARAAQAVVVERTASYSQTYRITFEDGTLAFLSKDWAAVPSIMAPLLEEGVAYTAPSMASMIAACACAQAGDADELERHFKLVEARAEPGGRWDEMLCRLVNDYRTRRRVRVIAWEFTSLMNYTPQMTDAWRADVVAQLDEDIAALKADDEATQRELNIARFLRSAMLALDGDGAEPEAVFRDLLETKEAEGEEADDNPWFLPGACYELATLLIRRGDLDEAEELLNRAKNNWKGYTSEGSLRFRVNGALRAVADARKKK